MEGGHVGGFLLIGPSLIRVKLQFQRRTSNVLEPEAKRWYASLLNVNVN